MIITSTADADFYIEGSKFLFKIYDLKGDETFVYQDTLYEFIAEQLECYDVDEWGELDTVSLKDLKATISELEDALQYAKELLAKAEA